MKTVLFSRSWINHEQIEGPPGASRAEPTRPDASALRPPSARRELSGSEGEVVELKGVTEGGEGGDGGQGEEGGGLQTCRDL